MAICYLLFYSEVQLILQLLYNSAVQVDMYMYVDIIMKHTYTCIYMFFKSNFAVQVDMFIHEAHIHICFLNLILQLKWICSYMKHTHTIIHNTYTIILNLILQFKWISFYLEGCGYFWDGHCTTCRSTWWAVCSTSITTSLPSCSASCWEVSLSHLAILCSYHAGRLVSLT